MDHTKIRITPDGNLVSGVFIRLGDYGSSAKLTWHLGPTPISAREAIAELLDFERPLSVPEIIPITAIIQEVLKIVDQVPEIRRGRK